jgi:hypothetical protein
MFSSFRRVLHSKPVYDRFWAPFKQNISGYDLQKYALNQAFQQVGGPGFSCAWNGRVGNQNVIEDYFTMLLSGFDIVDIQTHSCADNKRFDGAIKVAHVRSFLSWKPTQAEFTIPFQMKLETGLDGRLSHVSFRANLKDQLVQAGCPREIAELTDNSDAMNMLVTLRRVRVKPEVITYNALLSASRKQEMWASALGML